MTDYDNRKENQAFEHVELLQRQRESAESDHKPQQMNELLVSVPRDPYFANLFNRQVQGVTQ